MSEHKKSERVIDKQAGLTDSAKNEIEIRELIDKKQFRNEAQPYYPIDRKPRKEKTDKKE